MKIKVMRLVFFWCCSSVFAGLLASEELVVSPLQKIDGGFLLCKKSHTIHKKCYDRYKRGCALCATKFKNPAEFFFKGTIFVPQSELAAKTAICGVCLTDISEPFISEPLLEVKAPVAVLQDPLFAPTAPPISPRSLGRSVGESVPPHIFYASYQELQRKIRNATGSKKADLMAQAHAMQAVQFRHSRK